MTASCLKQDPNTKRFKRTLIYFNTHNIVYRQYAKTFKIFVLTHNIFYILACCVSVLNKCSFEPFCVWILFKIVQGTSIIVFSIWSSPHLIVCVFICPPICFPFHASHLNIFTFCSLRKTLTHWAQKLPDYHKKTGN